MRGRRVVGLFVEFGRRICGRGVVEEEYVVPLASLHRFIQLLQFSLTSLASTPGDATSSGVWDSIHVFEASERGRTSNYRLTSTVILSLATKGSSLGELDLSGNMTRQVEQDLPVDNDDSHIANIGRLVEDMELKMRNLLQEVYFGKAKDVVGDLRSIGSLSETLRDRETQRELIGSMRR